MKTYYKVVQAIQNGVDYEYISAMGELNNPSTVKYKLNEWAYPNDNTRLFVFDDLNSAKAYKFNFDNKVRRLDIYECKIKGGIKGYPATYSWLKDAYWEWFKKLLKAKKSISKQFEKSSKFGDVYFNEDYPSVLATAVMLTKRIA
jgi:hypothetical protein